MRSLPILLLTCIILQATILMAQKAPLKIGDEFPVNIATEHPYNPNAQQGYIFEETFYSEDASYIKIHFSNFQLAEGDYVIITSPETEQEFVYSGSGLWVDGGQYTISDFWSYSIFADEATVRLYSTGQPGTYGFDIDRVAYGYPQQLMEDVIYESICGGDDKENIACYSGTTMFDRGDAVCRLVIGGSGLCTGWLLGSEGHVLTNNHCVGSQNEAGNVEFQFNYQYNSCNGSGNPGANQVAQTSTLVCTDGALDYTLLQLPVNPTNTYGFLSFRSTGPVAGERIYIPQHPGGSPKKISVDDDNSPNGLAQIVNTNGGGNGTRVEYYSDTEGGSSGSPVLGYNDHLVVALHNTGGCLNGGNRTDAIINDMGSCLPVGAVDNPGNVVVASFTIDAVKSCDGNISLTNQSFNDDTRTWYFGDGTTSTQQNPTYSYSAPGNYTVQLIVEDASGNQDTATQQVDVALVSPPAVSNDTLCGSGSITLTANGSGGPVYWYDSPSATTPVHSGATFTTPNLATTTTYYVEEEENTPLEQVGAVDNNIGGGQSFTSNDNWGLYFDVNKTMLLNSVKVYAGAAGNRTIELVQNGNVLESTTINIPAGESRIDLNYEIAPGDNYLLKVTGATVDLYRNDGGATYPYTVAGLVSITGNNTTSGTADDYYYYFYDWEVREKPCISDRGEVQVVVKNISDINFNVIDVNCQFGTIGAVNVNVPGGGGAFTYNWSNGATTANINNLSPGNYTLTVDAGGGCTTVETVEVGSAGLAIGSTNTVATCNSYLWPANGQTYTTSGFYTDTTSTGICDSIQSLDLTIQPAPTTPQITVDNNELTVNGSYDSYQWFDQFGPITGATGSSLTSPSEGTYYVVVENSNGCSSSSDTLEYTFTGIAQQNGMTVQHYPNPTTDKFYVQVRGTDSYTLVVYNSLGQQLQLIENEQGTKPFAINMQAYPGGTYFVKVEADNSTKTFKVLKR